MKLRLARKIYCTPIHRLAPRWIRQILSGGNHNTSRSNIKKTQ